LNSQRPSGNRIGLGYSKTQEYSIGNIKFRPIGFIESQIHERKHSEINNEEKSEDVQRGNCQWRMNQSLRQLRYFPAQSHNSSKIGISICFMVTAISVIYLDINPLIVEVSK